MFRTRIVAVVSCLAFAAASPAQGPGLVLPRSLATAFGPTSTNRPFAAAPTRHQQLFLGSELPVRMDIRGIGLRKDDRINSYSGTTVELEIRLAQTSKDDQTMSTTFADNFDAGAPVTVFQRRLFRMPDLPWNQPADVDDFYCEIPFDQQFTFARGNGNLLLEVLVWSNGLNSQSFLYPLDAGPGASSTVYANGPTATAGVRSSNGLAIRFLTPADHKACWAPQWPAAGPVGRSDIELSGGNPPLLGGVATMDLYAPGWDLGAVALALGVDHRQLYPMPGYLLPVYPDLRSVLGIMPVVLNGGFGSLQLPLPNDRQLLGLDTALQAFTAGSAVPQMLGGSNLLLGNLGNSLFGSAVFAILHGPLTIAPASFLDDGNGNHVVVHQAAGDTPDKVNIQGTKTANVGPLQIHVTDPSRIIPVPAGQSTWSVTVTVNPGGQVFLANADTAQATVVSYEVTVVD